MGKEVVYGGYRWERQTKTHLQNPKFLESYGYKVYSQNDEDGILQEIFNRVGTETKKFIEFGVQDGLECNTHYLLHKGWTGLWLEGDDSFYRQIQEKFAPVILSGALKTDCIFITRENINAILEKWIDTKNIDFLSIDIDGNDYHVWNAISCIAPRVVCIEYNGRFSPDVEWIQPYSSKHVWNGNDYFGASLKALEHLGAQKGYQLVGTNLTGVNAFFVRTDLAKDKFPEPATAENLYNAPQYTRRYITGHPNEFFLPNEKPFIFGQKELASSYKLKKNEAVENVSSEADIIRINELTDGDMLLAALENMASKTNHIVIENGMCNYGITQVIWCFLDRYKMFLDSVYIDGFSDTAKIDTSEFSLGRIYIKLKNPIGGLGQPSYSTLADAYTKSYYLTDCGGYNEFSKSHGMTMAQRLKDVYKLVGPIPGEKILDIGCGRGELTFALAKAGAKAEGIDYSKDAIAIAKKNFEGKCANLRYACADIFKINNLNTFDKIVMADVVEHIEQKVLDKIYEKISVSISSNGCLIIHTAPNKDYYEITYPRIREQARKLGCWKPSNPRTYYEQLMHINEQTPRRLETTLKKYFKYVKVWTGSIWEINNEKTLDESRLDTEIFAMACQKEDTMKNFIKRTKLHEKPKQADCKVQIEASDTIVSVSADKQSIAVTVTNLGSEIISSERRYPINLTYHILDQNGNVILFDGERTPIEPGIHPGSKRTIDMRLRIPPGLDFGKKYICRITLVAEDCFWFDQDGTNKKDIALCIQELS